MLPDFYVCLVFLKKIYLTLFAIIGNIKAYKMLKFVGKGGK